MSQLTAASAHSPGANPRSWSPIDLKPGKATATHSAIAFRNSGSAFADSVSFSAKAFANSEAAKGGVSSLLDAWSKDSGPQKGSRASELRDELDRTQGELAQATLVGHESRALEMHRNLEELRRERQEILSGH